MKVCVICKEEKTDIDFLDSKNGSLSKYCNHCFDEEKKWQSMRKLMRGCLDCGWAIESGLKCSGCKPDYENRCETCDGCYERKFWVERKILKGLHYENKVGKILSKMGLKFKKQYKVFIGNNTYRFDYYLEDKGILLEVDERGHFEPYSGASGKPLCHIKWEKQRENDRKKTQWAVRNGFRIGRLPYTLEDQFENEIKRILCSNQDIHVCGKNDMYKYLGLINNV